MENPQKLINWRLSWQGTAFAAAPLEALSGEVQNAARTLDEVSLLLPAGAYTTFRTYQREHALRFQEHLDRLGDSAQRIGMRLDLNLPQLRVALREIVRQSPFPEARIRISLDLTLNPGEFYVSLEELHLPPEQAYEYGVRVISRAMHRDNPRAKLTQFIATAAAYRAQLEAGVNEMLMIGEDGSILEGLSSNFFGVVGGVLRSANEGVLNGITRSVVLDLAKAAGIPVELRGVRYQDWPTLDECFITSASRGVLPVIQIDEHVIAPLRGRRSAGPGQPGPITRRLVQEFTAWVQKELDEI